jgi:hypothetical protein
MRKKITQDLKDLLTQLLFTLKTRKRKANIVITFISEDAIITNAQAIKTTRFQSVRVKKAKTRNDIAFVNSTTQVARESSKLIATT